MPVITYREALNQAMVEEMERDPLVFLHAPEETCAECDEARSSVRPNSAVS